MSAAMELQAAIVAALRTALDVPVFDGVPGQAPLPHASIEDGHVSDWSTKTGRGAEHRVAVAVHDDGTSAARLHALVEAAVAAIGAIPRDLPHHRIASCVFLRSRVVRGRTRWSGLIEFRVRTAAV